MPESVTDRPTSSHEHVFLLAKSAKYFYDADAIREDGCTPREWKENTRGSGDNWKAEGGAALRGAKGASGFGATGTRNKRTVWTINTHPWKKAHFATFPPKLVEPCIKAGCPVGGTALDPFAGAGTVGVVAKQLGRDAILIELNSDYIEMMEERIAQTQAPLFV